MMWNKRHGAKASRVARGEWARDPVPPNPLERVRQLPVVVADEQITLESMKHERYRRCVERADIDWQFETP